MKKLVFAFFGSFFSLMFIWSIIGYQQFGADLVNKHFDLQHTLETLTRVVSWDFSFFNDWLIDLKEGLNPVDQGFWGAWESVLNTFLSPVRLVIDFLAMLLDVVLALFEFIFYPKFI